MTETQQTITVAKGNIHIPRDTCEAYLKGVEATALLPHDEGILIYPLIPDSAGGLLLKIRNLHGDRVIHAQEFFRNNDYVESSEETHCSIRWITERAALLVENVPRATK